MITALVGGAGFIGRSVAQALIEQGIEVRILDTGSRLDSLKRDGMKVDTGVLEFPDTRAARSLLEGMDVMIHLACTTEPASSMQSFVYDAKTNVVPSVELFHAAKKAGVRRVVFASSGGTVYGRPKFLPVTEDHPTRPLCAYGVSKLAIENYLALCSDIEGISLRLGNPYGSYQLTGTSIGLIANFLNAVHSGRTLQVWGDGSIIRDYLHIDDLAEAFVSAVVSNSINSGSYNIGSGIGRSIIDIINLIFSLTVKEVPVNFTEPRPYDVQEIVLDSSRYEHLTGWQAKVDLEEGIQRLWESLSQQ